VRYLPHSRWLLYAYRLSDRPALAAATFLRSLAGFGFPLFAPTMYRALGYGKGDTILAVAAIVLGCPACVKATDSFLAHV
jgi:hypothetical protein